MAITASDRIEALREIASRYKDHLVDISGVTLSATLRLVAAECARDAIHCKACINAIQRDACLRPGTNLYNLIASVQHDSPRAQPQGEVDGTNAETVITTIVHALVNHQTRLDKDWYDACIKVLSEANIVPASIENEKRLYLLYSAFAEILCVAVMSYCINVTFLTMGRPVPPLPSKDEIQNGKSHASGPLLLDWTKILKRAPSRDTSLAFAYYFEKCDIDKKSTEYLRISERARQKMAIQGDPVHPCLCSPFAAEDTWMVNEMDETFYMPAKDFFSLFKGQLDPAVRCADDFTRFDAEFVANSMAKATQCDY